MIRIWSVAFFFALCGVADAACSGSGTTWTCTAGSSADDIQTAIDSSSDGATITVAAGSSTWSTGITFSGSKATTLICASAGGCTITGDGVIGENAACSGDSTKLQRISGFVFSGGNNPRFWWAANGDEIPCTRILRIDHNTFTGTEDGGVIMLFGHFTATDNYFYGVIDHNSVATSTALYFLNYLNGENNPPIGSLGASTNLFVEDNTLISTIMDGGGGPVCVDAWGGAAIVVRYNTFTNCRISVHGVTHAWGPRNLEVYNNSMTYTSGAGDFGDAYRAIHHQGSGTFIVYNNTVTPFSGHSGSAIALLHYRSWTGGEAPKCDGTQGVDGNRSPSGTYKGYPCHRQPGRDPTDNFFPIYVWNNKFGDDLARIDLSCEAPEEDTTNVTCNNHVVDNRDYFNAVGNVQTSATSPFNGTTGMGFGTLANRPTTCSVAGTDAGDVGRGGVGYFATDAGAGNVRLNWTASTDNVGVTGYKIYRNGTQIGTSATNLFIDDTASPTTAYNYTVSSYDAAGNESAQSSPQAVTTTVFSGLGILYRCGTANDWVTHYAPYTYPHPLAN